MNITRIYSDEMGESHFEEFTVPLTHQGDIGSLSENVGVDAIQFREVEPEYIWDFHQPPNRQYIVLLDGRIEIETSLGEKRIFNGGDILLVEDITGKGHKTRNLIPTKRKSIFIKLP
ncbi:MAG: hypothetical protein QM642_05700 [Edaphocola sp.]